MNEVQRMLKGFETEIRLVRRETGADVFDGQSIAVMTLDALINEKESYFSLCTEGL